MRYLVVTLSFVFLISCNAVRVNYDYDKTTDFSNYSTYNYFSDMETGLSELDEKRLLRALDSTLQAKGYLLAEEPDFLVNILSSSFRRAPNNAVGVGVGGTGRNVGGGVSVGIPIGGSGLGRNIQFDLVDAEKDVLFWQANSESSFNDNASPSVREDLLYRVLAKVFAKFPPEK